MTKKRKQPQRVKTWLTARWAPWGKKLQIYLDKRPHRSFRRTKNPRGKFGGEYMPPLWRHFKDVFVFLWQEKRLYGKFLVLYAVVSFLTVGGIAQVDFIEFKDTMLQAVGGNAGAWGDALTLFTAAISGVSNSDLTDIQQLMGGLVLFVFWLALVWATRMRVAGEIVKVRDALYNGGAPLISSIVLFAVVLVQLAPAAVGVAVLNIALSGAWLQNGVELMAFSLAVFLLCLLSLYWITASLLGMVVVTLPRMYPWEALSNASELVIGQRWRLAFRIVALALAVFVCWAVILIPALLLDGWLKWNWLPLIPITAQLLAAFSLVFSSVYIYKTYRSLL